MTITADHVRDLLHYDTETGVFTWKMGRPKVRRGMRAGCLGVKGHRIICIDRKHYYEHRLAWLLVTGEWPPSQIDHINCDKADNRFCNLRLATNTQQRANSGLRRDNTSGVKGVRWHKRAKKWQVNVGRHYIGLFVSKEEATTAYAKAAQDRFGEFARIAA